LGLELKALQRPHEREMRQAHGHRQSALLRAGHLGCAEPCQCLAQIQLAPRRLLQQPIKLLPNRPQPQTSQHPVEIIHQPLDFRQVAAKVLHRHPCLSGSLRALHPLTSAIAAA
jgi:hypothetical protein